MMTLSVVEVRNVSKRYGPTVALRGVSLELEAGRVLGVLGPNGSGKSTLMRLMAGLSQPSAGQIRILGEKPGPSTRARVAYVPEVDCLYPSLRVEEMLDLQARFFADFDRTQAAELLEFMHLTPRAAVRSLSKGQRARLKLILALARRADLILLDEPFSGIDPPSRERILQGILATHRGDRSLILSTHLVREAEKLFDRVVFLSKGEIFLAGDAEALRQERGMSIEEIFREEYN